LFDGKSWIIQQKRQLMDAFNELHEEAKILQCSNNRFKGGKRWWENRLKQLEEENENLKTYREELEIIYKNSATKCENIVPNCNNC